MNPDIEGAARAAVQITRAAPLFDQLVDMLLTQAALASDAGHPLHDAARQAHLRAAREQLDAHYPEFQRLYYELLHKHLDRQLPAVLAALNSELVQTYFKAQKAMEAELIDELQRLAEKMAHSPLDGLDGTLPWGVRVPGA